MHSTRKKSRQRVVFPGQRIASSYSSVQFYQFPPALFVLSFFLDLSFFLTYCITLCWRQAVWPVYSSVASRPLTLLPFLFLSLLFPPLILCSSLAHLHCRHAIHGHVLYLSPYACAIPILHAYAYAPRSDRLLRQPVL